MGRQHPSCFAKQKWKHEVKLCRERGDRQRGTDSHYRANGERQKTCVTCRVRAHSHAITVADILAGSFARSGNFDNITVPKPVVSGDGV